MISSEKIRVRLRLFPSGLGYGNRIVKPFELTTINRGQRRRGKPPLGSFARSVQASAGPLLQAITAQDGFMAPSGEACFEISIKNLQVPKPQEPSTPPSPTPTQEPRWTTPRSRGRRASPQIMSIRSRFDWGKKRFTEPSIEKGEPSTFAEGFRERSIDDAQSKRQRL